MAEKSSFFTSLNGDRKYKASEFAEYFGSFISNGIFPNPSTNLEVTSNNDMTLTVNSGYAWINGYMYSNTSPLTVTLSAADSVLNRIDRIVVRYDSINRNITTKVLKGANASNPSAPNLQRDNDIYDICLATVTINKGVVSISQNNIVDNRSNLELCGWVNSLIKVDGELITKQLEEEFNVWFEGIKGALDGDVAGNLLNKINKNTEEIDSLKQYGISAKDDMVQAINSKKTVPNVNNSDSWKVLSKRVSDIKEGSGNATNNDVLIGKTFTNNDGVEYTGTMPNRTGIVNATGVAMWPDTGIAVYPPGGYYSGIVGQSEIKVTPSQVASLGFVQGGKKWASGEGVLTYDSPNNVLTVSSNFGFIPSSIIIAPAYNGGNTNIFGIYLSNSILGNGYWNYASMARNNNENMKLGRIEDSGGKFYVNSTGFSLPANIGLTQSGVGVKWIAYE